MINIGFKVLDKKNKNNIKGFYEIMKEKYKGEEISGPCGKWYIHVRLYKINDKEVMVANMPLYHGGDKTSAHICGENRKQIFGIKADVEKETKFKLKKVKNGN